MTDRMPFHWTATPPNVEPLTDREVAALGTRVTRDPAPVPAATVLRLLARYLRVWAAADQLLELTGHVLTNQRWPQELAVAEGELHVTLDTHDDL